MNFSLRGREDCNLFGLTVKITKTAFKSHSIKTCTVHYYIGQTWTLFPAHSHVYWATFNMLLHFPSVERQTGRLSDCQSAVITFKAPHWSAAPQTPGMLPQPLTFPLDQKISLCKSQSYRIYFVDWNYDTSFNQAAHILFITLLCQNCSWSLGNIFNVCPSSVHWALMAGTSYLTATSQQPPYTQEMSRFLQCGFMMLSVSALWTPASRWAMVDLMNKRTTQTKTDLRRQHCWVSWAAQHLPYALEGQMQGKWRDGRDEEANGAQAKMCDDFACCIQTKQKEKGGTQHDICKMSKYILRMTFMHTVVNAEGQLRSSCLSLQDEPKL